MSAAVWIALGAVFIALIPAIIAGTKRADKARRESGDGGSGSTDASSASGSDCGTDGGGACD